MHVEASEGAGRFLGNTDLENLRRRILQTRDRDYPGREQEKIFLDLGMPGQHSALTATVRGWSSPSVRVRISMSNCHIPDRPQTRPTRCGSRGLWCWGSSDFQTGRGTWATAHVRIRPSWFTEQHPGAACGFGQGPSSQRVTKPVTKLPGW
jgi:hypothetical protein